MSDVRLLLDDANYGGWESIRCSLSMQAIANDFSLSVTERWPGQASRRPIRRDQRCGITLDGHQVLTGWTDEPQVNYDSQSHKITVTGRSLCGDLVDCSAEPFDWRGLALAEGIVKLVSPFGIRVIDRVGDVQVFQSLKSDTGATVFEVIEQAARVRGVLLTSDFFGSLVITRASNAKPVAKLRLGYNIERASRESNGRNRFSSYRLMGQQQGSDFLSPDQSAQVLAGPMADPGVTRHRPFIITPEWPLDTKAAEQRLRQEVNLRAARAEATRYTVRGWYRPDGELWSPNVQIEIDDEYQGFKQAVRLVTDVDYYKDNQGTRAELTVMPREAFEQMPMPEPARNGL